MTTRPVLADAAELRASGAGTLAYRIGGGRTAILTTAELHDAVHDRRRRAG